LSAYSPKSKGWKNTKRSMSLFLLNLSVQTDPKISFFSSQEVYSFLVFQENKDIQLFIHIHANPIIFSNSFAFFTASII